MMSFQKQLLNSFFYEKKVTFDCNLFRQYYDSIFPSPQLFVSFLLAQNREEQVLYAKRIIKRMFFCKHNAILFDLYKNLINLEEKELVEKEQQYTPRDHSVHSVNTYLLGIYLFFEFRIFNYQLHSYFKSKDFHGVFSHAENNNAFLAFLETWKLFSLNHDIGYPLELLTDNLGNLKSANTVTTDMFNSVSELIIEEYTKYELLFLIGLQIISDSSNKSLTEFFSEQEISALNNLGLSCDNLIRLENIFSYKIFDFFSSALNFNLIYFKVQNSSSKETFYGYYDNKDHAYIHLVSLSNRATTRKSIEEVFGTDCCFDVFYPQNECKQLVCKALLTLSPYTNEIKNATNIILSQTTISYAGVSDESSFFEFLFEIYQTITTNLSTSAIIPDESYYKTYIYNFKKYVTDKIQNFNFKPDCKTPVPNNLRDLYSQILLFINDPSVVDNFMSEYNSTTHVDLSNIYLRIKAQYDELLSNCKESLFLNYDQNKLLYNLNNKHFNELIEECGHKYEELCKKSSLIPTHMDFSYLFSYRPSHSLFDHGITSCYLVLETFFKTSLVETSKNKLIFKAPNIDSAHFSVLSTASYAILVHNMRISFFSKLYNTSVKHEIIKNPFVYFCLFCDNMQIWDRPYRVNQGTFELETATISSNDISIFPTGNKICIQCITLEAEKIVANYRNDLDEYLLDGSKLISLNISDK